MTIYPYLFENTCWVFDDERTGLKEEAFVLGMTEMISRLVEFKLIPNASKGFSMIFAAEQFNHDLTLNWISPAEVAREFNCSRSQLPSDGNWYRGIVAGEEMVGWLCPALFCYFDKAPKTIYVKAEPLPAGFDPNWHVGLDDPRAKRFISAPKLSQN